MTRPARSLLLLTACLMLAATASAQKSLVQVDKLDGPDTRYDGDCTLGNAATAHAYSGWWSGDESYAALVQPEGGDCSCGLGIAIQSVHMSLWLEPGTHQLVQCRLLEAVPNGPGCWIPGDELVVSGWQSISDVAVAAVYDIEIPTYFWCAEIYEPYFVTMDFFGSNAPGLRLVGGGSTESCTVWNDWGDGWTDLVGTMGFLDNLTLWADTDCCSAPIPNEPVSWGDLKSSYR